MRGQVANVVFDLDGTLVDSLPGIETSLQWAVTHCLPGRTLSSIRDYIGPPLPTMLARFWPDLPEEELERAVATFREHYDAEGCRKSVLFPGVAQTLATLEAAGIQMFVLTNKRTRPTMKIVELTDIRRYFRAVISPDSVAPPFPTKAAGALALRDKYGLDAAGTLLVGDGTDDGEAAAAAGFRFVAAGYGYGRAAERMEGAPFAQLKTFSDLERIVL
ncbi:MAG: HAD hydrolase-like protein [Chthoniobacterales bacterium]